MLTKVCIDVKWVTRVVTKPRQFSLTLLIHGKVYTEQFIFSTKNLLIHGKIYTEQFIFSTNNLLIHGKIYTEQYKFSTKNIKLNNPHWEQITHGVGLLEKYDGEGRVV